jgi:hypothetical protein
VAIEDGAGNAVSVAHPDPNAAIATSWTEWQLPLSLFGDAGVDVTGVTKMAVGLGNREAPLPGGAGTLLFDDFRVMLPEALQEPNEHPGP